MTDLFNCILYFSHFQSFIFFSLFFFWVVLFFLGFLLGLGVIFSFWGGAGLLVRQIDLTHLSHISVHEDQTNVSVDHIQNLLDGMTRMLVDELADARTDHGLLSEQEDGLSAEGLTDISNLLRADVLDISNEQLAVILEDLVELDEVELLLLSSRHLSLHDVWDG